MRFGSFDRWNDGFFRGDSDSSEVSKEVEILRDFLGFATTGHDGAERCADVVATCGGGGALDPALRPEEWAMPVASSR